MTASPNRPLRLAYLVSHPIHYQAPLLRMIAAEPDIALTVFFQSDYLLKPEVDPDYGVEVDWQADLTGGFNHVFLPRIGRDNRPSFFRPWTYGFWKRLIDGRFDALWVHGYARFDNILAMLVARLLGIRVLVRDDVTAFSKTRGPVHRALKRLFFLFLRGVCDGFTTVGTLNAVYFREEGIPADRLLRVPYAVDNRFFREGAEKARQGGAGLRSELGIEADAPVILFVARLLDLKRPEMLLAAYARIVEAGDLGQPYLVFVGDGPMRTALEAEAARLRLSRVRLAGFSGQARLPAYYAMADFLVLPSDRETWGLVVNEAMASGLPVIASDRVGCHADLVREDETGLVFPAGDVDALAAALRRLLADRSATAAMGKAAQNLIENWDYAANLRGLRRALRLPGQAAAPLDPCP